MRIMINLISIVLLLLSFNKTFSEDRETGYLLKLKLTVKNVDYFEGMPQFNYYFVDSLKLHSLINNQNTVRFTTEGLENILDSMLLNVSVDSTININCARFNMLSTLPLDSTYALKINSKLQINSKVKMINEEQINVLKYDTILFETNSQFSSYYDTLDKKLTYFSSNCIIEYGFCKVNIEKCKCTQIFDIKVNQKKLKNTIVLKEIEQNTNMDNGQRKILYYFLFNLLNQSYSDIYESENK